LYQTLDLKNFATARRPLQVLSTSVDAQCDKLATVVGRQFITLSVHLCVQRYGREAARRTGRLRQLRLVTGPPTHSVEASIVLLSGVCSL